MARRKRKRRGTPFTGEMMVCIMCGRQEASDPAVESQWRMLEVDGTRHYTGGQSGPNWRTDG